MQIKMQRSNILHNVELLEKNFYSNDSNICLPIELNYAINRNRIILSRLANLFLESRNQIIKKYGKMSDENSDIYFIEDKDKEKVQKEFFDFLEAYEDVDLYLIKIEDLPADLNLTTSQMESILFMISEKKED